MKTLVCFAVGSALVLACRPPTPAEEVKGLGATLKAAELACANYQLRPSLPRDPKLTAKCAALASASEAP